MARRIVLWLFVFNLGIALGAGLYEARIVLPGWIDDGQWNAEEARRDNTGVRFWVYVTTIPLTLLTLVNLFYAWKSTGDIRRWWLTASLLAIADRIFTFSYFIPTMVQLMQDQVMPNAQATAMFEQWIRLNYLRHAITLGAFVTSLKTFKHFEV